MKLHVRDSISKLYHYFRMHLSNSRNRSSRKMSLGDSGRSWPGFVTAGLSGDVRINMTTELPGWMKSHYEFIWSERMLEHIDVGDLPVIFQNIASLLLLERGSRCRMCLPICFWGTQDINMVRSGNEYNCERQGHVTWFTHEGYGPITAECFGAINPPVGLTTLWVDGLQESGLVYEAVRHYQANGELFVNESIIADHQMLRVFVDEPLIEIRRPDSLIFDLVRI